MNSAEAGQGTPEVRAPFLGLRWGIKTSFVNYIKSMKDGRALLGDGATVSGDGVVFAILDPAEENDSDERVLAFRGDVRFSGHFGMLSVRLTDPLVRISGREATLSVRDHRSPGQRLDLVRFRVEGHPAPPPYELLSGVEARLEPAAVWLFNDVYGEGEPFDDLTIIVPTATS